MCRSRAESGVRLQSPPYQKIRLLNSFRKYIKKKKDPPSPTSRQTKLSLDPHHYWENSWIRALHVFIKSIMKTRMSTNPFYNKAFLSSVWLKKYSSIALRLTFAGTGIK